MEERPSEECGNCLWWCENPFLCMGCPNNPETEDGGPIRPDEPEPPSGNSLYFVVSDPAHAVERL